MEVKIARSFIKDFKLAPKIIQQQADKVIQKLIIIDTIQHSDIHFVKMEGQRKGENYYRIRIGDWRMGIECMKSKVIVLRLLSRGAIYKKFPPN